MPENQTGLFVVLEGGEGSGKSTQLALLTERVREVRREVITTFEPGGTPFGAQLRSLLLDGGAVESHTEALLIAADRATHVAEVVRPALERGAVVVTDRFTPSSLAYQGVGRDLGVERVAELSHWATNGLEPDVVVILDVDDTLASERLGTPGDRMERESGDFHSRVRAAYRELAATHGWHVVDGSGSRDTVATAVWEIVGPLLSR